ncbi:MAG: DUF1501 domain-containing protein [Phycisphaerae bacterium]|jgi:uncharacterized protein (DUF1501 family)
MTTRREFLVGCSSAIAAMSAARLSWASFDDVAESTGNAPVRDTLVLLFLRGGIDGLHLLAPVDDKDYVAARPAALRVGEREGLAIGGGPAGLDFRLHPNAAPLKELYDSKQLAFIHACGLTNGTRSHFEAMDLIERGVADVAQQRLAEGWLARFASLERRDGVYDGAPVPVFAAEDSLPTSLLGLPFAAAAPQLDRFGLWWGEGQRSVIEALYTQDAPMYESAQRAMQVIDAIGRRVPRNQKGDVEAYKPQHGADYPDDSISVRLQSLARLIKMDVGLRVASVDYGGWDTHQDQTYHFPVRLNVLSRALHAFYTDITDHHKRTTVLVISEFGRRLKANKSAGTDHGHGGVMMALGGNVNGGRTHGNWPGLATDQLDSRVDLAVTTDYRAVLAEALRTRMARTNVDEVFPGFASQMKLGLFRS